MHPAVVSLHAAGLPDGVGEGFQASPVWDGGALWITPVYLILCRIILRIALIIVCLIFFLRHTFHFKHVFSVALTYMFRLKLLEGMRNVAVSNPEGLVLQFDTIAYPAP